MEFGKKISELRKSAKLSQEQLSEKLNVTRQTISNWELGQTVPDIIQAKEISKIFNVTLDELVDNDIHDILVKKITITQDMTHSIIKAIKFLFILIICFLIIIISMSTTFLFMFKADNKKKEEQEIIDELRRKADVEYRASLQDRYFHFTYKNNDNQIILTYDKNYKPVTFHMQGKLTDDNSDDIISSKAFSIFSDNYMQYTDVRTFIADAKSYFENHGGSWKEIFDKNNMPLGFYR